MGSRALGAELARQGTRLQGVIDLYQIGFSHNGRTLDIFCQHDNARQDNLGLAELLKNAAAATGQLEVEMFPSTVAQGLGFSDKDAFLGSSPYQVGTRQSQVLGRFIDLRRSPGG